MLRSLRIGLPILAVSTFCAAANLWAGEAFPTQWGGPNIGAGALQLLFYVGAGIGFVFTMAGITELRRKRKS